MFTYNGGGIAFGGKCCWNYNNDTARNVVIFGVDNSLLSDIDNPKSNFLVLGKEPTESVNGSVGTAEKKSSVDFSEANTSLYYNRDESYLHVNKTEIYKFKPYEKQRLVQFLFRKSIKKFYKR